MENNYIKITQETPNSIIERAPISKLPKEILEYYKKKDYMERRIPLSAKLIKEIAEILKKENNHG